MHARIQLVAAASTDFKEAMGTECGCLVYPGCHQEHGVRKQLCSYVQTWPKSCMYTVYDRIFQEIPANNSIYRT